MEWVAAGLPLTTAAVCAAAFFLAGRESKADRTSVPPPSGGSQNPETSQSEPESFFPEENQEQPTLQIVPEWRSAKPNPSAARRFSLPTRDLAFPPTSGTPSSEVESTCTPTTVSPPAAPEAEPSAQPPIWLSHWASNSQPKWLSGSDTAQLQRVSTVAPLAIAGGPASSPWWAPGHASLYRSSANASSTERSSHRAPTQPNLGYLPPWARRS